MGDLHALFWPASIAVIGASTSLDSLPGKLFSLLLAHGYPGRLYPVNPKYEEIQGIKAFPSVLGIPETPELALVVVRAKLVPGVLEHCVQKGVPYALVFSSGFAEAQGAGKELDESIQKLVSTSPIRLLGPNSEGFVNLAGKVAASFSPTLDLEGTLKPYAGSMLGSVSAVNQSGALGFSFFDRGLKRGLGFRYIVSTGNETDVSTLEIVQELLEDQGVGVLMLYIEGLKRPSVLRSTLKRAAELKKPVVVLKGGRSEVSKRAALSHTSSLAGEYHIYEAFLRRYGALLAKDDGELLDTALALSLAPLPKGQGVGILTLSGGAGILLADLCVDLGLNVPRLSDSASMAIEALIPEYGSAQNPVDITAQALATGGFAKTLEVLYAERSIHQIAVIASLGNEAGFGAEWASIERTLVQREKPVLFYSYTEPARSNLLRLKALGAPCYATAGQTAKALKALHDYRAFLREATESFLEPRPKSEERPAGLELPQGRVPAYLASALLAPYGIPFPKETLAHTLKEAVQAASKMGYPVALKLQSPQIVHKTDTGALRLDIQDAFHLQVAYQELLEQACRSHPGVKIEGVLVQAMAPKGLEVLVGIERDQDFGPLMAVGLGGVLVEALKDVTFEPLPVTQAIALKMLDRLKSRVLLEEFRGRPSLDKRALVSVMERLSGFALACGERLIGVELNPVRVFQKGALALDVRMTLQGT